MTTQQDITQWFESAPPEQVVQVTTKALDRIAGYSGDFHSKLVTGLKSDTRQKLFDRMPA